MYVLVYAWVSECDVVCVHECIYVLWMCVWVCVYNMYVCVYYVYECICVCMYTGVWSCEFMGRVACCSVRTRLVRSGPVAGDLDSCLQMIRYTGDSKIDPWNDRSFVSVHVVKTRWWFGREIASFHVSICSHIFFLLLLRVGVHVSVRITSWDIASVYFYIIINYRYLLFNYYHVLILLMLVNYCSWHAHFDVTYIRVAVFEIGLYPIIVEWILS